MNLVHVWKDNRRRTEILEVFLIVFLICFVLLKNLDQLNGIYIIGDEYGYWAAGAYFAGMDWSEVTTLNSYYSYGYGFLLTLILYVAPDMIWAYKAAIVLNTVMVLSSFFLLIKISEKLFSRIQKKYSILLCGCVVLYSNVVFQAQTTQAEILLFFLFCLMVYILLKFLETGSLFSGLLTSVISAYMFMVHMRCIAIWVAWIITVLLLFGKKQYHKGCILLILILGILLLWAGLMMKNVIKENAYLTSLAEEKVGEEELAVVENNTNEFSGQVENIKRLFTMEGLKQFIVGYLGKIYYLCVSTFLIIFWAVRYLVLCIKDFFMENRKDQTVQRSAFFSFFLLLSLILTVAVSALFMITVYRQDNLVYGRYNEHILGPFLLIGLMELTKEQEKISRHISFIEILIFMTVLMHWTMENLEAQALYDNNVVGIYYWADSLIPNVGADNFVLPVSCMIIVIYLLLRFVTSSLVSMSVRCLTLAGLCAVVWINVGYGTIIHNTLSQQKNLETDYAIYQNVKDGFPVYFVNSESMFEYVDYLQFFHGDKKLRVVDIKRLPYLENGAYVFGYSTVPFENLKESYICQGRSKHFVLYQKVY